jgi:hypothetical protein
MWTRIGWSGWANGVLAKGALHGGGTSQSTGRSSECDHEPVTLRLDLTPPVTGEEGTNDPVVLGHQGMGQTVPETLGDP